MADIRQNEKPLVIDNFTYKYVVAPIHTKWGDDGKESELRCKLCGDVIASRGELALDNRVSPSGRIIERVEVGMHRHSNYCEAMMSFEEPNEYHMTTGCKRCMNSTLQSKHLMELYQADIADMEVDLSEGLMPFSPRDKRRTPKALTVDPRYRS